MAKPDLGDVSARRNRGSRAIGGGSSVDHRSLSPVPPGGVVGSGVLMAAARANLRASGSTPRGVLAASPSFSASSKKVSNSVLPMA